MNYLCLKCDIIQHNTCTMCIVRLYLVKCIDVLTDCVVYYYKIYRYIHDNKTGHYRWVYALKLGVLKYLPNNEMKRSCVTW